MHNISNKGWLTNATKFVIRNPITCFLNIYKNSPSKARIKMRHQTNFDHILDLVDNKSVIV